MANLQVKNVPDALHEELRRRAEAEGVTLRDYVLRVLTRDVQRPTVGEWLRRVGERAPVLEGPSGVELVALGRGDD